MNNKKHNRVCLCLGSVLLATTLHGTDVASAGADAGNAMQNVMLRQEVPVRYSTLPDIKDIWRSLGAENQYISGDEIRCAAVLEQTGEKKEEEATEQEKEELVLFARSKSLAGTTAYADVTNFVNVRKGATTSSAVVGKLYEGCVAAVLEEEGDWVYIKSGNVTGYVVKKFLLFGKEAEAAIEKKYSPKIKVTANVLNIRAGAGTNYEVIGSFRTGAEAELEEKGTEWMKIRFSSDGKTKTGYVYAKYVKVTGEPKTGETLAEEAKRIEAEKKAAAKAEAERKAAKEREEAKKKEAAKQAKAEKAKKVAEYAKTAVGTAYVWGGTNMKTGVDCSGLCYAAYKNFGYTLPRVSRDMAASSTLLSVTPNTSHLRAGDLVFYASGGRVDHVAMYIGDGKVVHASDYSTGVIISRYNYRTPHSAKRVIY